MARRTDTHRKGAIIPAEYTHMLEYHLPTSIDGIPVPGYGINCLSDQDKHDPDGMCCVTGLRTIARVKFAEHGHDGKCSVCGSHFIYGSVWRHDPTGEHIHIGHTCEAKYNLLKDHSAFMLGVKRRKEAAAVEAQKAVNAQKRIEFLKEHDGLKEALETDHHIVQNIKQWFVKSCALSDKQIELVFKLADEANAPKVCEHCGGDHDIDNCPNRSPITSGRQTCEGKLLGTKDKETNYGWTTKMLVLLCSGSKVWATLPTGLCEAQRGDKVRFSATLKPSHDDKFFGFGSRPTKAEILKRSLDN